MHMMMNTFMTGSYKDYPVVFEKLQAHNPAGCVGICILIFVCCFVFRGVCFVGSYLEDRVFPDQPQQHEAIEAEDPDDACTECDTTASSTTEVDFKEAQEPITQKIDQMKHHDCGKSFGQIMKEVFCPGQREWRKDMIRLLVALIVSMMGYWLMLVAMTFIWPYFMAICVGLACSQVFFGRLSTVLGIGSTDAPCSGLHG